MVADLVCESDETLALFRESLKLCGHEAQTQVQLTADFSALQIHAIARNNFNIMLVADAASAKGP